MPDRDDDDDDDRPTRREPRVRAGDRPPVLFLAALAVGTVGMFGCCSLSGWGMYSVLVGTGSGGGWSPFGANEVEITQASRTPGFGFGAAPQVSWAATISAVPAKGTGQHYVVMKCGGVTHAVPIDVPPLKGATLQQSMSQPALRSTTGPLELWVERRDTPTRPGKRVSNVYTVR